jgi:Ca-activated chloride channel family protein
MTLSARAERALIRPRRSYRHVDFRVGVTAAPRVGARRNPVTLALVVDRSGSMQGEKLVTAKQAARAVVEHLDERDRVAVVIFDDRIDVLQPLAPVTEAVKAGVAEALGPVEACGATALHEGWLTGCHQVAGDIAPAAAGAVARCFLLTDGQANRGLTEPEAMATQAADVLEQAGVGTSTFGIGDYNDLVLGPMAVAGGGQFHHLRSAAEIAHTFVAELGELHAVAARHVCLEIETDADVAVEVVSEYHARQVDGEQLRQLVTIGDLLVGEERHVVVRFGFPARGRQPHQVVRARLVCTTEGGQLSTDWQEVTFTYADDAQCNAEQRDPSVMHWVGLHHSSRAQLGAMTSSKRGDMQGARRRLREVAGRISAYAGDDADLQAAVQELEHAERDLDRNVDTKERWYASTLSSRGQRDLRSRRIDE